MSITAEVNLTCDNCGDGTIEDLKEDQTPEDRADDEGWMKVGILLDKIICPECAEDEEIVAEMEKG